MEFSLNGSQINLATRITKPTNGIVYNTNFIRPNSASLSNSNRSISGIYRPSSADNNFFLNLFPLKYSEHKKNKIQEQKRSSSSSNILKLLLSEPIQLSSSTSIQNLQLLKNKKKLKSNLKMVSATSSCEEDIKENSNIYEDNNNKDSNIKFNLNRESDRKSKPPVTSCIKKTLKFSIPLQNSIKPKSSCKVESKEENNDNFNLAINNKLNKAGPSSAVAWYDEVCHKKTVDLPGRVSFSTNDMYEIDYSDYENDESVASGRQKKSVHFYESSINSNNELNSPKSRNSHNTEHDEFCCTSQCSSFGINKTKTTNEFQDSWKNADDNDKSTECVIEEYKREKTKSANDFQDNWKNIDNNKSTDSVIEEYKREIEDINMKHKFEYEKQETSTTTTNQINQNKSVNSSYDFQYQNKNLEDFESKFYNLNKNENYSFEENNSNNGQANLSILNNFSNEPIDDSQENWLKSGSYSEQNLMQLNSKSHFENQLKSPSNSLLLSDSSDVIKNYLAAKSQTVKDEVQNTNTKKKNNTIKKIKMIKEYKKPKSACNLKNKSSSKIKKAKSLSCLRENSNLDEFQIDKIQSWMSMHEDTFKENDGKDIGQIKSNYKEWKETIRNSKTDDEGNFSLEDQRDNTSMESTYDEIVSIIKEIDSDSTKSNEYNNLKMDMELRLQALVNSSGTTDSPMSEENNTDKMKEILTYLDDIDSKCDKTLEDVRKFIPLNSDRSELEFSIEADIIEDVPKISDLVMFPNHQLARRIVTLSLRANELSNAILLSKEHVSHVRAEKLKAIRIEKQNTQNRLKEQKTHYECIVQRHQVFIEQLLKDKSKLCDKISNMTRRIDSQNQAWEHKIETEITRTKETVLAGEKIRREKWVRDNTKKIKELTVKGLELEINKMTSNHQKEMLELKRQHQEYILDFAEEQKQKYQSMEKAVIDSISQDRETSIERERSSIREKFEKQMEIEQETFNKQKHRLLIECQTEKERIYLDIKERENEFDLKMEHFLRDRNEFVEQIKNDCNEKLKLQEIKHQSELSQIKNQFESDYTIWKREYESTMKRREIEREDLIRLQCTKERDRQIDTIISNVDTETVKTQQEFELKFIRLKDKYDIELQEIEKSEKLSRERYNDTRSKLAECQATIQNEKAIRKQLELELSHSKKRCDEFVKEKENLKDNARKDIDLEIKSQQKERDKEIERIYERVQHAMEKKDSALEILQKENTILKERSLKLEAVIRQQRKDYCIK